MSAGPIESAPPAADDLINRGVILLGPPPADASLPRTFIVTGLGRSGTSMVAAILAGTGLLARDSAYNVTLDDREFLHALSSHDRPGLEAAIARRNQAEPVWAFKIPSVHGYLEPRDLDLFRNPHLIVVMRDIVAIARRHATSEHKDPAWSLLETARGQADLLVFLTNVGCPILSISYEKTVLHPETAIQAIADFASIPIADDQRGRLAALIEPDNRAYAQTARRRFDGNIDGIFQGRLLGWCRDPNDPDPVSLDLLINGVARCSLPANRFRADLKQAGIGDGNHGFEIDTGPLQLSAGAILALRVAGRTFILPGSGKAAWMYYR